MAISDWVINKSVATHTVSLTTVDPMVDLSSLSYDSLGGGPSGSFNMYRVNVAERARVRGVYQFLIEPTAQSSGCQFGFTCMNSALDVTQSGTSCYLAGYNGSISGRSLFIRKFTNGLDGSSTTLDILTFSLNNNDILPIEIEWNADDLELGGTRLILRRGNIGQTDFTGLTDVFDVIDNVSPLLTTQGEGPAGVWSSVQGPYKMDALKAFDLLPA